MSVREAGGGCIVALSWVVNFIRNFPHMRKHTETNHTDSNKSETSYQIRTKYNKKNYNSLQRT